jgi:ParB/RepB/Spo0J family partition protein
MSAKSPKAKGPAVPTPKAPAPPPERTPERTDDRTQKRAQDRAQERDARAQAAAAAATAVDDEELRQIQLLSQRRRAATQPAPGAAAGGGPSAPAGGAQDAAAPAGAVDPTRGTRRQVPRTQVRRSPYQPPGRPSEAARGDAYGAIRRAGGLELLLDQPGEPYLGALSAEARDLVELAADIALHGLREPLIVRQVAGGFELLSGHRRLVAAELADLAAVPVVDRGVLSDEEAELEVARANGLRVNFTAWQEAKITGAVSRRLAAAGARTDHRSVGKTLGFSHTKVGHMLAILGAWPAALLATLGNGDPEIAEEKLAAIGYRTLLAWTKLPEDQRLAAARTATGLLAADTPAAPEAARANVERRATRGGGWALTVRASPERLPTSDLFHLREVLAAELARVSAACEARGPGSGG